LKKAMGPELLDGLLFSVADWPFKGNEAIADRFRKRTGEPWMTQDGLSAYGDMWLLKEAIEEAGAADRVKIGEVLHNADLSRGPAKSCYPGPIKFDANGRRQNVPMIFAQWQSGMPVTVFPPDLALAKPHWSAAA
jgi:branched-chain amino acid transport system substrate-binding protein